MRRNVRRRSTFRHQPSAREELAGHLRGERALLLLCKFQMVGLTVEICLLLVLALEKR